MQDNIIFSKIWEDDDIIELKVECSSSVATISSEIYVSNSLIDELICQIKQFIVGNICRYLHLFVIASYGIWLQADEKK